MQTNEAIWLLACRADYLASVPTELQDFVKANVYSVAAVCNFYYPTERNNGTLSFENCYDSTDAQGTRAISKVPGFTIAMVDEAGLPANSLALARNTFRSPETAKFMLPLTNVKEHKVGDKTYLTQLDPEFIRYLGDILDLTDLLGKGVTANAHIDAYNFKSGSNVEITNTVMSKHSCWVDSVGSIAILSEDLAPKFKEKFTGVEPIKALKTASLYKGTAPYFGPDRQSIANLASGGRFFLYSTTIEIFDNGVKSVPFIGLAVFGGDKLIKYKNALSLIDRIQGFSESLRTQAILYPEKYKEVIKLQAPPIAEYWPSLTQILGEKSATNSKYYLLDTSTIKRDDEGKFKAFFINSVLSKTPEASRFLAMKAKHEAMEKQNKELKAKLSQLEKTIASLRTQVETDVQQIRDLQQRINQSKEQVDRDTESLIDTKPQAERVTNAALEILTQLQPLEADYNSAIAKYWEQDASLDTLHNWEQEGFLIKELVLYDGKVGTTLDTAEKIRARMSKGNTADVFIYKMTVYTTSPTIIYKDAHSVGRDKAVQHAGGPYIVNLNYDGARASMSIRLLDDRSVRATWSDGYYRFFCIHPHTAKFNYDEAQWKRDPQTYWSDSTKKLPTPCMGEFEPILAKGMKGLALAEIIYGLRGWLQTATSTDGYGANVVKFPLAKDIVFTRYLAPKPPEAKKIEEIKPVFSKQSTYIKKDGDKYLGTIFLTEDTKVMAYEVEATPADEKLVFTEKNQSIMLFLNTSQRDSAMGGAREELEKNGYNLFAEQKAVAAVTFEFPFSETPVPDAPPVEAEPYRPASARRITEQVINELQDIVENPPENPAQGLI